MKKERTTEWERAVGGKIQELRKAKGLSQSQLAKAADVSFRSLQNYEQGHRPVSLQAAAKLAQALDCTIDELAGRPEAPPADQSARPRRRPRKPEAAPDSGRGEGKTPAAKKGRRKE